MWWYMPVIPDVVVHACNPSNLEDEGRGKLDQGQPGLNKKFQVSLSLSFTARCCLKKKKKKKSHLEHTGVCKYLT
jgi:hypothetical protein